MEIQMATHRTAKIHEVVGPSLPRLLNSYIPNPVPDKHLVVERSANSGVIRAWESKNLDNASRVITSNDDTDSRYQIFDLDVEGEKALLNPVLAVTDIIGEEVHSRLGESNTNEVTLDLIHSTFLSLALMLANPKAHIQLTLTDGPGGQVNLRFDVSHADMGALVGKQGRTARCLRGLLANVGRGLNRTINLDIREATT